LLLPELIASGPSRVVTVSSRAHKRTSGIVWDALQKPTRSWTGIEEYAVSKLANLLFSAELARRTEGTGLSCYSLHPGVVDTEIWRALPDWARPLLRWRGLLTAEEGAQTTLHCARRSANRVCISPSPEWPRPHLWAKTALWPACCGSAARSGSKPRLALTAEGVLSPSLHGRVRAKAQRLRRSATSGQWRVA
jgi:NAD(P)-dependent dehydrogenase (short-subunit alcohol dehydrogenase family)